MADDHDFFASKFLDGYERMIENGYDSESELQVAPTNSWFGYYTMEGNLYNDRKLITQIGIFVKVRYLI